MPGPTASLRAAAGDRRYAPTAAPASASCACARRASRDLIARRTLLRANKDDAAKPNCSPGTLLVFVDGTRNMGLPPRSRRRPRPVPPRRQYRRGRRLPRRQTAPQDRPEPHVVQHGAVLGVLDCQAAPLPEPAGHVDVVAVRAHEEVQPAPVHPDPRVIHPPAPVVPLGRPGHPQPLCRGHEHHRPEREIVRRRRHPRHQRVLPRPLAVRELLRVHDAVALFVRVAVHPAVHVDEAPVGEAAGPLERAFPRGFVGHPRDDVRGTIWAGARFQRDDTGAGEGAGVVQGALDRDPIGSEADGAGSARIAGRGGRIAWGR